MSILPLRALRLNARLAAAILLLKIEAQLAR
jgi:hypothetical protein